MQWLSYSTLKHCTKKRKNEMAMTFIFAFFSESWFFGSCRVQNNYQVCNRHQTPHPMTCINAVNCEELVYNNTQHFTTHIYPKKKREPSAQGYNWATLFLGDTNMRTWPSRLGESQMRQQNMAVNSAGLRPKSDYSGKAQKQLYNKLQPRPLVGEGATK
jgi:hypothetical protein